MIRQQRTFFGDTFTVHTHTYHSSSCQPTSQLHTRSGGYRYHGISNGSLRSHGQLCLEARVFHSIRGCRATTHCNTKTHTRLDKESRSPNSRLGFIVVRGLPLSTGTGTVPLGPPPSPHRDPHAACSFDMYCTDSRLKLGVCASQ